MNLKELISEIQNLEKNNKIVREMFDRREYFIEINDQIESFPLFDCMTYYPLDSQMKKRPKEFIDYHCKLYEFCEIEYIDHRGNMIKLKEKQNETKTN